MSITNICIIISGIDCHCIVSIDNVHVELCIKVCSKLGGNLQFDVYQCPYVTWRSSHHSQCTLLFVHAHFGQLLTIVGLPIIEKSKTQCSLGYIISEKIMIPLLNNAPKDICTTSNLGVPSNIHYILT